MSQNNNSSEDVGYKLKKEIQIDNMSEEETFYKLAHFYSDNKEHGDRMYEIFKNKHFGPSTPVMASVPINGKAYRGAPIACYLNEVSNIHNIANIYNETMAVSNSGGGLGTLWDNCYNLKEDNDITKTSFGVLQHIQAQGKLMRLFSGFARKMGSLVAVLSVDNPEIEDFIDMRKNIQGIDPEVRIPRYIHHCVIVTDAFMECVKKNLDWDLVNSRGECIKKVNARSLFMKILTTRSETGAPYILFIDNAMKGLATHHKKLGLKIKTTNLCTEILLPTGKDHLGINRTAICCLGSINLAKYDEWKNIPTFFDDIARFYDNILTYFIVEGTRTVGSILNYSQDYYVPTLLRAKEKEAVDHALFTNQPMANAIYSAYRSRDLGLGTCGLSTLAQSKNIPFDSDAMKVLNKEIFEKIKSGFDSASIMLANERGPCPDAIEGDGFDRFSYKTAIAPTAGISYMMGVSKCIEIDEPIYLSKTYVGFNIIKNQQLLKILEEKGMNNHATWMKIAEQNSLNGILSKEISDVFKSAYDIDQRVLIDMIVDRPIDQSQSFNMFVNSPIDQSMLLRIHLDAWKKGVKTLYYLYSNAKISASQSITASVLNNSDLLNNSSLENVSINQSKNENLECYGCQ